MRSQIKHKTARKRDEENGKIGIKGRRKQTEVRQKETSGKAHTYVKAN